MSSNLQQVLENFRHKLGQFGKGLGDLRQCDDGKWYTVVGELGKENLCQL